VTSAARADERRLFLEEYTMLCRKHRFIIEVVVDYVTVIDISVPDVIGWDSEQQLQQHIQELAVSLE
jgi:hypothetical protein